MFCEPKLIVAVGVPNLPVHICAERRKGEPIVKQNIRILFIIPLCNLHYQIYQKPKNHSTEELTPSRSMEARQFSDQLYNNKFQPAECFLYTYHPMPLGNRCC